MLQWATENILELGQKVWGKRRRHKDLSPHGQIETRQAFLGSPRKWVQTEVASSSHILCYTWTPACACGQCRSQGLVPLLPSQKQSLCYPFSCLASLRRMVGEKSVQALEVDPSGHGLPVSEVWEGSGRLTEKGDKAPGGHFLLALWSWCFVGRGTVTVELEQLSLNACVHTHHLSLLEQDCRA